MANKRFESGAGMTIGETNVAITGSARHQHTGMTRSVLHEDQLSYGAVVHRQVDFSAYVDEK